jgi:thiopurine S-methyltransferase
VQHQFWHQRWQQNQIGFHSAEIHTYLQTYWLSLAIAPNSRVFVPLCGKSNDMLWLLAQGYQVVGVELSPIAVEAFFSENSLVPTVRQQDGYSISEIEGLQIFCGDFFSLPAEMRADYVAILAELLEAQTQILLISFDYCQENMQGPPFSVNHQAIEQLYQPWCQINRLASDNIVDKEPHFKTRGLDQVHEQVYRLTVV